MSDKLEKLRLDLEKARQRRAQLNRRIDVLERRVQEEEATQINEMVRNAKVTPEQLATLLQQNTGALPNPDTLRAVGAEIMTDEEE